MVISKLYSRAYVHGNPLQVTDTLSKYAEKITKPDMTRAGFLEKEKVIELSISMLKEVFDAYLKSSERDCARIKWLVHVPTVLLN